MKVAKENKKTETEDLEQWYRNVVRAAKKFQKSVEKDEYAREYYNSFLRDRQ